MLQYHPFKDNPDAPLWISSNNRYRNKPIIYPGARAMIHRIFEKAGYLKRAELTEEEKHKKMKGKIVWLKKKCNPHHFRKSRASINAPIVSESILCDMMGWVQGSREARTYVHLSGGQVKKAYLEARNIIPRDTKPPETITCICGEVNNRKDKYCYKCYRALSIEVALNDAEKKKNAINEAMLFMSQIIANPELKQKFEAFQKSNATQGRVTT